MSSWHARAVSRKRYIPFRETLDAYVERGDGGAVVIEGRVEFLEELPWQFGQPFAAMGWKWLLLRA
jgi:hypothetical protein